MAIMSSGPQCRGMTASLSDATQTLAVRAPPFQLHLTFQTTPFQRLKPEPIQALIPVQLFGRAARYLVLLDYHRFCDRMSLLRATKKWSQTHLGSRETNGDGQRQKPRSGSACHSLILRCSKEGSGG